MIFSAIASPSLCSLGLTVSRVKGDVCFPSTLIDVIALNASSLVSDTCISGSSNRTAAVAASLGESLNALKFAEFADGVFQGLGYTAVLICMCLFRELLGSGTIGGGLLNGATSFLTLDGTGAGLRIFPETYAAGALVLPFGGFLTLGLLMALLQHILSKSAAKKAAKEKEETN